MRFKSKIHLVFASKFDSSLFAAFSAILTARSQQRGESLTEVAYHGSWIQSCHTSARISPGLLLHWSKQANPHQKDMSPFKWVLVLPLRTASFCAKQKSWRYARKTHLAKAFSWWRPFSASVWHAGPGKQCMHTKRSFCGRKCHTIRTKNDQRMQKIICLLVLV